MNHRACSWGAGCGPSRRQGLLERNLDLEHASYFVSRIAITPTDAPGMQAWRKHLFIAPDVLLDRDGRPRYRGSGMRFGVSDVSPLRKRRLTPERLARDLGLSEVGRHRSFVGADHREQRSSGGGASVDPQLLVAQDEAIAGADLGAANSRAVDRRAVGRFQIMQHPLAVAIEETDVVPRNT